MQSKHVLIIFVFFAIRKGNVRRMEEQRIRSREDTAITEFLVDTEKLRSFKLFSNTIKNGGPLV